MKVAIASNGKEVSSEISLEGGRAPYYLIFEDKKFVKEIKNPFQVGGGAGFSVAQMLYNEGVELVICGNFGPNMERALDEKGIKAEAVVGKTVKEALEGL